MCMEAAADLTAAIAAARAVTARFHTASDAELLADLDAIEQIGRVVDGLRFEVAAQVGFRSDRYRGMQSLAFREGARDGVELVQQVARIPRTVANQRVGLGSALSGATTLAGELLPGDFPVLSAAIQAGEVGLESARVIVETVKAIRKRADPDRLAGMVDSLTTLAKTVDTANVRYAAADWALALDPDGAEPRERAQRRKRALRLGQTLADGTTRLTMILPPEDLAIIRELLQSRRREKPLFRTTPGGDDTCEETDPEWRERDNPDGGDPRSRVQEDYDSIMDVLKGGIAAEDAGFTPTTVTHETVVTIAADELEARKGQGWAPGVLADLPIPVIERRICSGGLRLLVTGPDGEALYLSRSHRVFSKAQRKALSVAAGGRCQYPGCRVPDPFLEAHHAQWYGRDAGPTHIDNGIMLCSYHHHLIHASNTPSRSATTTATCTSCPGVGSGHPKHDIDDNTDHHTTGTSTGKPPDPRRCSGWFRGSLALAPQPAGR